MCYILASLTTSSLINIWTLPNRCKYVKYTLKAKFQASKYASTTYLILVFVLISDRKTIDERCIKNNFLIIKNNLYIYLDGYSKNV